MNTNNTIITCTDLSLGYGKEVVLAKANLEIKKDSFLPLIGPNGAGKTTTLRILTGYFNPTLGQVKYDDLDIIENDLEIKKKIGYLPENNPLYEEMTVKEYLTYAAQMHEIAKEKIKNAVNTVAETCGLKEKINQEIGKLSKGYKQRVGLAQALIHDPEILILDEPTEGLDPNQRIDIRGLIKTIGEKKTVILSSHVLSEVEATCSRVLIINQGKIVASGTPEELKQQTTSQTKIFLKVEGPQDQITETIKTLDGVERIISVKKEDNLINYEIEADSTKDIRKPLVHLILDKNWELYELSQQEKSLEDIFVKVTTQKQN